MPYNDIRTTEKRTISRVTIRSTEKAADPIHTPTAHTVTRYFVLHATTGEIYTLFISDHPLSSWQTVVNAELDTELESFMAETFEAWLADHAVEPEMEVRWHIQCVRDQLKPQYWRIVDVRAEP